MTIKELKLDLLGKIKKPEFQVRRKMLSKVLEGELASSTKGRGMEFTGFRNYVYGDDASQIDWPASLRAKTTLIREYEVYKSFNLYILFDVSDSMLFSSTNQLKCEYAAEVVFSIIFAIISSGSKIGMSMFTDKLITRNVPETGTKNYYRMLQDLTNPENYGGPFSFKKALLETKALLTEKSLIIIISDFIGLEEGWHRYVRMLSVNFDLLAIMVRDPRDREMPVDAGQFLIEDPYTGEKLQIDTKDYAKIYKERVKKEEEDIAKSFRAAKAGFISVSTKEDFLEPLLKYMSIRSKMLVRMREG